MSELFEVKHWIGEFFVNGDYEKRFVGEVDYSPENGVILTYSITGHEVPDEANIIQGVFSTGEKCTLVGKFTPQNSGFIFKNGLNIRHGKAGFSCLVIGEFLEVNELFSNVDFTLTGMQEFFFPKGHKDLVKYSETPLFTVDTEYGRIEVSNNAEFGFLYKDVSSQIYSRNKDALNGLKQLFEDLEKEYPDASFMLKKDIGYRVFLKFDSGFDIISTYKHISDIANLFSILICDPVYPDSIHAIKKEGDNHPVSLIVYPSMLLDKRTLELCLQVRSNYHMPITMSNIDLEETIKKWTNSSGDYTTIVSSIQNETGYRDEHSLHGELVLYSTQFESISYNASMRDKKYEYPIDEYGSEKIKKGISSIFSGAGEADIGKGIGNLRNEITHVGRPKQLLNALSMQDKVLLSRYLQMTILGFMLNSLGLDKHIISDYQDKFLPNV